MLDAPEVLARAALGVGGFHLRGMGIPTGIVDEQLIQLLTEALETLGSGDSVLRAMVMGQLALALYYSPAAERRAELSEQAVAMARRLNDPETLAATLQARRSATWGPTNLEQRLADGAEIIEIAKQTADKELELLGRCCRYRDLLDKGDIISGDAERSACDALAEELRQPLYLWAAPVHQAGRALIDGRYDDAEQLIFKAYALGQRLQAVRAQEAFASQMATLRSERESVADLVPMYRLFIQQSPGMPAWRCALARVCMVSGMQEDARLEYESLAADDFRLLPRDVFWLLGICLISDVCSEVGEPRGAAVLYNLLLPFENLFAIMGMWAGACYGAVSHYLGLLATMTQQWDAAERHFEDALVRHTKLRSRPWVAHTQSAYAKMRLARDAPGDREAAMRLLDAAIETARELGMKNLLDKALAPKLRLQGIDPADTQTSIYAVASAVGREQPDLRPHAAPDGTVTILFSDIEGSAALTEQLGDQRWLELLRTHNNIVREHVAACDGYEVKAAGDGFMIVFQSARRALKCAINVQAALAAHNARNCDPPLNVRMGLHTGEAIKERDDFFGKNVVLAARIGAQAHGGEILISRLLKELTESAGDLQFGQGREVTLKGLSGSYELFPVLWTSAASP
jgi:class 3 adenylate cyclase